MISRPLLVALSTLSGLVLAPAVTAETLSVPAAEAQQTLCPTGRMEGDALICDSLSTLSAGLPDCTAPIRFPLTEEGTLRVHAGAYLGRQSRVIVISYEGCGVDRFDSFGVVAREMEPLSVVDAGTFATEPASVSLVPGADFRTCVDMPGWREPEGDGDLLMCLSRSQHQGVVYTSLEEWGLERTPEGGVILDNSRVSVAYGESTAALYDGAEAVSCTHLEPRDWVVEITQLRQGQTPTEALAEMRLVPAPALQQLCDNGGMQVEDTRAPGEVVTLVPDTLIRTATHTFNLTSPWAQ